MTSRLARVCRLLNEADADYLVVGATAMQLWGTTRAAQDIDILIAPTIENAARVLTALAELPLGLAREHSPEEIIARPVTMLGNDPNVDVLTRAWDLRWDVASRDVRIFSIDGVEVPTVSIANLIESKRTGRPQDAADILTLEELQQQRRSQ